MFVTGSLGCQEKEIERLGEGTARRRGETRGAAEEACCLPAAGKDPEVKSTPEVDVISHRERM